MALVVLGTVTATLIVLATGVISAGHRSATTGASAGGGPSATSAPPTIRRPSPEDPMTSFLLDEVPGLRLRSPATDIDLPQVESVSPNLGAALREHDTGPIVTRRFESTTPPERRVITIAWLPTEAAAVEAVEQLVTASARSSGSTPTTRHPRTGVTVVGPIGLTTFHSAYLAAGHQGRYLVAVEEDIAVADAGPDTDTILRQLDRLP